MKKYIGLFQEDAPITSFYGYRTSPITGRREFHDGIDVSMPVGWNIRMPQLEDGTMLKWKVTRNRIDPNWGNVKYAAFQDITSGQNVIIWLFHILSFDYKENNVLGSRQYTGKSGNTGMSTAPHTHICVEVAGKRVDPLPYLVTYTKSEKTYLRKWLPEQPPLTPPPDKDEIIKQLEAENKILKDTLSEKETELATANDKLLQISNIISKR